MSREEDILKSIIDDHDYDKKPLSRIEELLLQLKNGTHPISIDIMTTDEVLEILNK